MKGRYTHMFHGIYTPIITPFNEREEIDYAKLQHNLDKWGQSDLDGIVVLGSNGEFPYLSEQEKFDVVSFVVKNFNKDKKIIVGTYCESTRETIAFSKKVGELGVAAVLVLPPNYYKGGMKEEVLYKHFIDVADEVPVPVMLYNMPGNTGINLSAGLVARLSKHPNIVGIKDTGGNIVQISEIVRDTADDFAVFAGNTGYLMPALAVGARGATLALANIMPQECCKLVSLMKEGKFEEAKALQLQLIKINALVTTGFGVSGLKAAADMLGYQGGLPRRPLRPASDEVKAAIKAELTAIGAL